jgi:hypothetical protein
MTIDPLKTVEEQLVILSIKSAAGAKLSSFEIADLEKLTKLHLLLNGMATDVNETTVKEATNLSREDFQTLVDMLMGVTPAPPVLHIVKNDETPTE